MAGELRPCPHGGSVKTCKFPSCVSVRYEAIRKIVTRTGKVLTDEDLQALTDEAEKGYDVTNLKDRKRS